MIDVLWHWLYVQRPEVILAVGFSLAAWLFAMYLVVSGFIRAVRNPGPVYDRVAASHGDASRLMPLADRFKALPCIECPHLRASQRHPSPDDRFANFTGSLDEFIAADQVDLRG